MDAAAQLFVQNGYDATSVRQIADVVGVTEAARFVGAIVMFAVALFALVFLPAVATRLADDEVPAKVHTPMPVSGD